MRYDGLSRNAIVGQPSSATGTTQQHILAVKAMLDVVLPNQSLLGVLLMYGCSWVALYQDCVLARVAWWAHACCTHVTNSSTPTEALHTSEWANCKQQQQQHPAGRARHTCSTALPVLYCVSRIKVARQGATVCGAPFDL